MSTPHEDYMAKGQAMHAALSEHIDTLKTSDQMVTIRAFCNALHGYQESSLDYRKAMLDRTQASTDKMNAILKGGK